jgi:hypothetical protein
MRKEAIVAMRPKMRVERLDAFLRTALHNHPPATGERLLKQRRQHAFEFLAV